VYISEAFADSSAKSFRVSRSWQLTNVQLADCG
jgi:hypothetical protein